MSQRLSAASKPSLLLMLLLVPGVSLADPESDWAREDPPSRPTRTRRPFGFVELGAGLLTGVGGGIGGFMAGGALCNAGIIPSNNSLPCLDTATLGLLAGFTSGVALGVWWGGLVPLGDEPRAGARAGSVQPVLAFSPRGSLVGLSGSF